MFWRIVGSSDSSGTTRADTYSLMMAQYVRCCDMGVRPYKIVFMRQLIYKEAFKWGQYYYERISRNWSNQAKYPELYVVSDFVAEICEKRYFQCTFMYTHVHNPIHYSVDFHVLFRCKILFYRLPACGWSKLIHVCALTHSSTKKNLLLLTKQSARH